MGLFTKKRNKKSDQHDNVLQTQEKDVFNEDEKYSVEMFSYFHNVSGAGRDWNGNHKMVCFKASIAPEQISTTSSFALPSMQQWHADNHRSAAKERVSIFDEYNNSNDDLSNFDSLLANENYNMEGMEECPDNVSSLDEMFSKAPPNVSDREFLGTDKDTSAMMY